MLLDESSVKFGWIGGIGFKLQSFGMGSIVMPSRKLLSLRISSTKSLGGWVCTISA